MWQKAKILENEIKMFVGREVWVRAERPRLTMTSDLSDIEGRYKVPRKVLETNIRHPSRPGVVLATFPNQVELLSEFKEDHEVPYISFDEFLKDVVDKIQKTS